MLFSYFAGEIYEEESGEWREEAWEGELKVDFAMTPVRCNW
jgi:hypothetical protein